jgi:hypothetical protein
MAEDDSTVAPSPADLRVAFRETCARITGNVNELEARVRTQVGVGAPPRRTDSSSLISDLWRVANVLKGSGVRPALVAGAATGYVAMRWWSRERGPTR